MAKNGDSERSAVALFACDPRIEAARKPFVGGRSSAVHAALLADTFERLRPGSADLLLVWRGEEEQALNLKPRGVAIQRGPTFGARLAAGVRDVIALGYGRVVLVGTDCPGLTCEAVDQALLELARVDVVFGPAADGGLNLLGIRADVLDRLDLEALPWQTDTLHQKLREALDAASLKYRELETLEDIDTLGGLARFVRDEPRSRLARLVRRAMSPGPNFLPLGAEGDRTPLVLFGSTFLKSPPTRT